MGTIQGGKGCHGFEETEMYHMYPSKEIASRAGTAFLEQQTTTAF